MTSENPRLVSYKTDDLNILGIKLRGIKLRVRDIKLGQEKMVQKINKYHSMPLKIYIRSTISVILYTAS